MMTAKGEQSLLTVGLLGADYLYKQNESIFGSLHIQTRPIRCAEDIKGLDGLWLSGWQERDFCHLSGPVISAARQAAGRELVVLGAAWGAKMLGCSGRLPLMNCRVLAAREEKLTAAVLEVPSWDNLRFAAAFAPTVTFLRIAPNLAVLCRDSQRGPVIVRQGNFAACGYVPELTKNQALYRYFAQMMKNARQNH